MGRKSQPLMEIDGIYYARYYEGEKRRLLSLGTGSVTEAMQRYPMVINSKRSWADLANDLYSLSGDAKVTRTIGKTSFEPPIELKSEPKRIAVEILKALETGKARFDPVSQQWIIQVDTDGKDTVGALNQIQEIFHTENNVEEIRKFYTETMPGLYVDKVAADRWAKVWLSYILDIRKIRAWSNIDDTLINEFVAWRKKTRVGRSTHPGKVPSGLTVKRHLQYLSKSFEIASSRGLMKFNPIKYRPIETYRAPLQEGLSQEELINVFKDEYWQHTYLMSGNTQLPLEYRLLDYYLLLFMAQKRRKEIIKLRIEDINFEEKFVSYTEFKNSSKGSGYIIQKAFYITAPMETFLRRVIGNRKSGLLFPAPKALRKSRLEEAGQLNGDHLSLLFKTICKKYTKKDIHLHNLRHTATDILEKAGLTAQDIDYCLGHYSVNTSLKNYQDRSRDAVARRISKLTEKGIEILSKTVESLI